MELPNESAIGVSSTPAVAAAKPENPHEQDLRASSTAAFAAAGPSNPLRDTGREWMLGAQDGRALSALDLAPSGPPDARAWMAMRWVAASPTPAVAAAQALQNFGGDTWGQSPYGDAWGYA